MGILFVLNPQLAETQHSIKYCLYFYFIISYIFYIIIVYFI